jgi:hypothetical protein
MKPSIWIGFSSIALILPGCTSSPPEVDLAAIRADIAGPEIDPSPAHTQVFDFGPILAHGQTLRHEFALANPSEKAIRLLKAMSSTPCCSAVEPLPDSILPHAEARVAVLLKPGYQSGIRVVRFAVRTDSGEQPVRTLILRARLFSEWEIAPAGDPTMSLPVGKGGKQVWHITCRRKGSEGLRPPESVKVAKPLEANFVGPATEQEQPDGVVEATRDIEVTLPAIPKLGSQQAELAFLWPDGLEKTQLIRWEITPRVRMVPSSHVLEPSDKPIERSIMITSDDGPFRITKIAGTMLSAPVEVPAIAARRHDVKLRIDPARGVSGGASGILIGTDRPYQPELSLSVLTLPPRRN